jgi:hypothetical protein
MLEKTIKVCAIHISVQQLVVADFAFGQAFSGHHAAANRLHVLAVPMFFKGNRNIGSCA